MDGQDVQDKAPTSKPSRRKLFLRGQPHGFAVDSPIAICCLSLILADG